MSSKASQAASSSHTHESKATREANSNLPRPHHFITRGDGSITPLIAVDELPDSIRIVGVPAIISRATTLNMMDLGVQARSQTKYIVEMPEDSGSNNTGNVSQRSTTTESIFLSREKRDEPLNTAKVEGNTSSGVNDVEQWCLGVKTVDETQAAIDAVVAANAKARGPHSSRSPKALTPGVFGEKKYCTHWIRWGECDYMQQGCKYKHEMPDDETLVSIGIRTVPKWYRDANASKNGWVERPPPSERVWRDSPSRAIQRIDPYRLPYHPGGELFRPPYISSDEPFRASYHSSGELFRPCGQPPLAIPGPRPTFSNSFAPRPTAYAHGSSGAARPFNHQYMPPPPKLLGPKSKTGGSSSRFPTATSSGHRNTSASTKMLVPASIPTSVSTASQAPAQPPAQAPAPAATPARSVAPPSPFSPPLTTESFSPPRVLPTSLAPLHRSLLPFLPPPEPFTLPPTPVPEIKTPAPRHRRLFVAAGESAYVENGMSLSTPTKESKSTGGIEDAGKWKELGKGIEELLVDFEE